MFSCYRKDEAHEPEIYCAAVAGVLGLYAKNIVDRVTDPRTGLPSQQSFLPTAHEVKTACEREITRLRNISQPWKFTPHGGTPVREGQGAFANVFVHADASAYETMKEWAQGKGVDPREWKWDENGRAGIWVTLAAFNSSGQQISKNWKSLG